MSAAGPNPNGYADEHLFERLRVALYFFIGATVALTLDDLLSRGGSLAGVLELRALVVAVNFGLLALLKLERCTRRPLALALFVGMMLCLEVSVTASCRRDIEFAPYVLSLVALYAAVIIRYGLVAQLVLVATAELALAANVYVVTGTLGGIVHYRGIVAHTAFALSLYLAAELERNQRLIRQAARALTRREAYFRSLIEKTSDLIQVVEPDGTIRYASPAHERVLGHRGEHLVGTSALADVHPDDRAQFAALLERTGREPGAVASARYRCQHADGSWRCIDAVGRNLLDDPSVQAIIINGRDITERQQMEAELRRSETYLKTIFDHAPLAFFLNDPLGRFVDGNRAAEELIGYRREELLGETFLGRDLLPQSEVPRAAAALLQGVHGPVGPTQLTVRHRDGHPLALEVHAIPITLDDQTLVLGIASDVTARVQSAEAERIVEQRLQRQRDALIALAMSQRIDNDDPGGRSAAHRRGRGTHARRRAHEHLAAG